jgi:hypothetical protein
VEIQSLWLIIFGAATPIAGVVGFAIQLRQIKKAKLENVKLQLEIAALKAASDERSQRIQIASLEEIDRYSERAAFARGPNPGAEPSAKSHKVWEWLVFPGILFLVALVVCYAIYDLYRLVLWLAHAL